MSDKVFFATATLNAPAVKARVREVIPAEDRFDLASDKWFISFDGTARELAEKIGVRGKTDTVVGSGLVLPVTTYSGRSSTALWEWLQNKGV